MSTFEKFAFTNHAIKRMAQRGISKSQIELVIDYGIKIYRTGIIFYYMTRKTIDNIFGDTIFMNDLNGITVLVIEKDGAYVIETVYKNPTALHKIKTKSKRKRIRQGIKRQYEYIC